MSEVSYRVVVVAGPYTWEYVNTDDPPVFGLALQDGLTLTRGIPDGDLYPAQPDPAVLKFGVVAGSWVDVSALDEGIGVLAQVYFPATATVPSERFAGRISDLDLSPHKLGIIINVTCVDFLADLAELPKINPPGSSFPDLTINHLHTICAAVGLGDLPTLPIDGIYAAEDFLSWPWGATDTPEFSEALEQFLLQWILSYALTGGTGYARYVIAQQLHSAGYLDYTAPYTLLPLLRAIDTAKVAAGPYEIPAAQVDTSGTFTRTKAESIQAVDVTWLIAPDPDAAPVPIVYPFGSASVARASVSTWLYGDGLPPSVVSAVGGFYLPNRAIDTGWRADTFTWRLKAADPGAYLPVPIYSVPESILGQLIDIVGIDSRWSPVGTTYRGVLAGYTLTLEKARPTVALDLRSALVV